MRVKWNDRKKIIGEYRALPLPLRAAVWFTIGQFLQKGIGVLTQPFIARMLSTEEYGRASTFSSWESIFLLLITLSSYKAVNNLCVKYGDRERVLSALMGYNLTVAAIWGLLLFLAMERVSNLTGLSYVLIICLYLLSMFTNVITCWAAVNQYGYSYRKVIAESLLYTFGTSFGALLAIAAVQKTAEAKIIPQVIFASVIGMVIITCAFRQNKTFCDMEVWKYSFCFCVPLLPHYLSEIVLMSSDRIMIDRMCGSSDVAVYSVAYTIGSLITMMTSAINSALAPYQYRKIKGKDYKALARSSDYCLIFIAFCLCCLMLFGKEAVLVIGGQKYVESISLIIPISLGVYFNYVFQFFARVQEYFEQKHTIVIASISCALLNIVLNYYFIGIYGYKAAAYTTFFCYFAFCFLHYLFYRMACRKFIGEEIYDIKGMVLVSVCLCATSVLVSLIKGMDILRYIVMASVLIVMIWKRNKIINIINSMRKKD